MDLLLLVIAVSGMALSLQGCGGGDTLADVVEGDLFHWKTYNNNLECPTQATVWEPTTKEAIADIVKTHDAVRIVGTGFSSNSLPCTSLENSALMKMGKINHITVEGSTGVRVGGGAVIKDVIDKLREQNLALVNNPWWIFGSVAGGISAESHWSWLKEAGSISATVEELTMVVADGTIKTSSRSADADFMKYASIAAGKLGPIYEAVLQVVPDDCFTVKSYWCATYEIFQSLLNNAPPGEEVWAYTIFPGYKEDPLTKDLTATPWVVQTRMKTDCASCCKSPQCDHTVDNSDLTKPILAQVACVQRSEVHTLAGFVLESNIPGIKSSTADDYELFVPLENAASCLKAMSEAEGVADLLKSPTKYNAQTGSSVSEVHARFIKADDAYLSATGGVDSAGINFDSGFRFRAPSEKNCENWKKFWDIGYSKTGPCQGRMHWGKEGYQHYSSQQAKEIFGGKLDTFKAKMRELDPDGKFWRGNPTFDDGATPIEVNNPDWWHDCTSIFQENHPYVPQ